ncbi:MAG: OmpA family protein [Aureispira sp.]|nr:OmpA family protein [Aureispira sp.]
MLKSKWLLLSCLFFIITESFAQNADKKWSIGIVGGKTEYIGDVGFAPFNFNQPFFWNVGLKGARYLNSSLNVALNTTFGRNGYWKFGQTAQSFKSHMFQAHGAVEYKFANGYILPEDFILNPYASLGLGLTWHQQIDGNQSNIDMFVPIALGLELRAEKGWSIFWQSTLGLSTGDNTDNYKVMDNDAFMLHQLGVKINLGKTKDSDEDGIADKEDECPEIAGLEEFKGCPDTDGDGIPDKEDDCPQAKGTKEFMGCPDTDKDGIMDKEDDCPDVAGLEEFKGCPDTDEDGVQDSEDDCPDVAGLEELKGCPDRDGDGIKDSEDDCPLDKGLPQFNGCPDTDGDGVDNRFDDCPNNPGPKENKGCPDADGDGVFDHQDKCPKTPGIAANDGCPEIKEDVKKVFDEALQGVQFNTGRSSIKKESFAILDKVVQVMKEYDNATLTIEGHTDNQGADSSNKTLSQSRSEEVLKYLAKNGISADRMSAKGYGEEKPVADNNTAEGRAKNRRVEFILKFD